MEMRQELPPLWKENSLVQAQGSVAGQSSMSSLRTGKQSLRPWARKRGAAWESSSVRPHLMALTWWLQKLQVGREDRRVHLENRKRNIASLYKGQKCPLNMACQQNTFGNWVLWYFKEFNGNFILYSQQWVHFKHWLVAGGQLRLVFILQDVWASTALEHIDSSQTVMPASRDKILVYLT